MATEEVSTPRTEATTSEVPDTAEEQLWRAELALIDGDDARVRSAQFAIRTAVRAQATAAALGTSAIDELLDARTCAQSDKSRAVYEKAICYLRAEQLLNPRR